MCASSSQQRLVSLPSPTPGQIRSLLRTLQCVEKGGSSPAARELNNGLAYLRHRCLNMMILVDTYPCAQVSGLASPIRTIPDFPVAYAVVRSSVLRTLNNAPCKPVVLGEIG